MSEGERRFLALALGSRSPSRMHAESQTEPLSSLAEVRWSLLETYALARQEGFAQPVGLVIDFRYPYARQLAEQLLVSKEISPSTHCSVTCMERSALTSLLSQPAPDLAEALRASTDEPGRYVAVLLARKGWLLSGPWQELFTLSPPASARVRRLR